MLTDEQIEQLRIQYGGQIGVVTMHGHQLIFKKPSRDNFREYRRKKESPIESPDALEQLSQVMIVAFDGDTGGQTTRNAYLAFLDKYPGFTSTSRLNSVMAVLAGMVETEDAEDLGKGASVRNAPLNHTQKVSQTGLDIVQELPKN